MQKKLLVTFALSTLVASSLLGTANAAADKQVLKDEKGMTHNVIGSLGKVSGSTAEERALNAIELVKGTFGIDTAKGHFQMKDTHVDENGVTHTKLDRVINGVKVFDQQMIVHEQAGSVHGVTGEYLALTPTAIEAKLTSQQAIEKAQASLTYKGTLSKPATAELTYLPQGDKAVLTYQVNLIHRGDQPGNWLVFVNAVDGSIVSALNQIDYDTPAVGTSPAGPINTTYSPTNGFYYLEDRARKMYTTNGGVIDTYDMKGGTTTGYPMTDTDNNWDASNQRAGVYAHVYAGTVYEYYLGLGRNSWDGNGASIYNYVHYGTNYNNAYWDGAEMVYGDGDGVTFTTLSIGKDVVAHELTHAVTQTTSNLTYSNQSGALNESWSDAQACVIDSNDWMIGEDIYTPGTAGDALRYMDVPEKGNQPSTMSGYVNTTSDNGGVHTNSGIPNHAFYLFATAINSRTIAGKIWYVASRDYMTSSTNFSGARAATLQATAALYGSSSSYYTALQNAWSGVGVN